MIHTYTGAGSRETLSEVLEEMCVIGESLAWTGFTLRSGGAGGADRAFEEGARRVFGTRLEIYLPWRGFNDNPSPLYTISPQAFTLASKVHPTWDRLSAAAKKLHVRNCHQVLGADFASPSAFVVCWAPDGCESERMRSSRTGGTGTAIVVADRYAVPVFNLARPGRRALLARYLEGLGVQLIVRGLQPDQASLL